MVNTPREEIKTYKLSIRKCHSSVNTGKIMASKKYFPEYLVKEVRSVSLSTL